MMAMAYCTTCSMFGNFTQCPNRFIDEGDGLAIHKVVYDEPRELEEDDRNNHSAINEPGRTSQKH